MRPRVRSVCFWLAALLAMSLWLWPPVAGAQEGPRRAGLVIRYGDATVETRCISFTEPSLSGAELLARAGLPVIINYNGGLGGAVCSIGGQGCAFPGQDCFCKCQGSACEYWAYYHWQDGRWVYSDVGASSYQVTDGALEGWSWGQGNFSSGTEPPVVRFEEICASAATSNAAPAAAGREPTAPSDVSPAGRPDAMRPPMTHYAGFVVFVVVLAGGWAWIAMRRRRPAAAAVSGAERKI